MVETAQTNYTEPQDAASMLQFLNPKEEIDDILLSLLGLQKEHTRKNGLPVTYIYRVNKPVFTDEYARGLVNDLRSFLNFTVQVSRFDDSDIKRKVGGYLKKLVVSLCTHGDDGYISSETWRKVLDIHENQTDENEKPNGWEKFGIRWAFNEPVTEEMIALIKDYTEEKEQAVLFDRIVSEFSSIIHASFNKSYSPSPQVAGMLLNSMTQIRTESQVVREQPKKGWLGSTFGRNE